MSFFNRSTTIHRLVGSMVIAAAAACVTPGASGQFGEAAGIAEAMVPDYYKRDVVIISQGLQLDETQRVIVNTLYEDYNASIEAGVARMKQRFEDMRDELQTNDPKRVIALVFSPFRDWSAEKARIGDQFLANVEVVLTEDQQALWPGVQRRLYREHHLHRGRLSGENLNLLDVVRDMHLDQRITVQIQPTLEAYEIALDRALHQRDDQLIGSSNPMLKALEQDDMDARQKAMFDFIDRQVAVRNVNDQYIEQVANVLPADLSTKFRLAALERAYPRIYRETPVQRIFKVAVDIEGLDSSTREAIRQLEAEFLSRLADVNAELLAALRKAEPMEARERASDFGKRMAGLEVEPKTDPTRNLFVQREELSRSFVKRLKELLNNDQFAMLPGAFRWLDAPADPQPAPVVKKNPVKELKGDIIEDAASPD